MQSLAYEKISTTTLPPKKFCNDERAKLCLFDTHAITLRAHQLYLAAKEVYQFIISKLPTHGQKLTLEPKLKADINVMLQSIVARLYEAASWYQPAETLLIEQVIPLAKQLGIVLDTPTSLDKETYVRANLTEDVTALAATYLSFGGYGLYSYLTK